jgi:hypothetical protein
MMINGDPAFPYCYVNVKVQVDGAPPPGWTRSVVEGRPDRQWTNVQPRTPYYFEHLPEAGVVEARAKEFWDQIKDQVHEADSYGPEGTPKYPNQSDVEIEIGEFKYGTWILDWFSHLTFDLGRSDEELIASFSRYVAAAQREGVELMGADDRWRWKGNAKQDTPPPCRCEHCVKAGIVRIDH